MTRDELQVLAGWALISVLSCGLILIGALRGLPAFAMPPYFLGSVVVSISVVAALFEFVETRDWRFAIWLAASLLVAALSVIL